MHFLMKSDFGMVGTNFLNQIFLEGNTLAVDSKSFFLQVLQQSEWH